MPRGKEMTGENLRSLMQGHDHQPFKVPDDYFSSLPDKIENRIHKKATADIRRHSPIRPLWNWSVAAAVLIGLLGVYFLISRERGQQAPDQLSQAHDTGLMQRNHEVYTDNETKNRINTTTKQVITPLDSLKTIIPEEPAVKNLLSEKVPEQLEITREDIIEYLLEEDIDITDLSY
ncbi:MAG: hypothetical protein AB9842_11270 [Bacteroidales bacterium]